MSRTLIVADDLTGACDAAVAFAQRGRSTRVLLEGALSSANGMEVCAISTGSRDIAPNEADRLLLAVASDPAVADFRCVFKKIDSVFRGNTVHEIGTAIRLFRADVAVIAPSYPALGRSSEEGVVRVRDLHREHRIEALDVLRSAGIDPLRIAAGMGAEYIAAEMLAVSRRERGGVLYCDATEQAHLDAAVVAADRLRLNVLWIGSGGLAHALAAVHPQPTAKILGAPTGFVLVFAGSDHPVSSRQIDHLASRKDIVRWSPGASSPQWFAQAGAIVVPIACGRTSEQDIAALAQGIEPGDVSCLFMTGGDTAALVCRALGIEALDLQHEFEPGLPQGVAVGGRFAGRTTILKSGGFGHTATISHIVEQFARGRHQPLG
jgi:uncharacterized protein YgbK (DUF1537 family)